MAKNMMWMGAGVGATLLYNKYSKDIKRMFKNTKSKMTNNNNMEIPIKIRNDFFFCSMITPYP